MKTFKNYALAVVSLALLAAEAVRNFLRRRTSLATAGLASLFLIAGTLSGLSHVPGVVISGSGTATIDGVFSLNEWINAGTLTFTANLPEGGTTPAVLYAMNNRSNLFLAVRFARSSLDLSPRYSLIVTTATTEAFPPAKMSFSFDIRAQRDSEIVFYRSAFSRSSRIQPTAEPVMGQAREEMPAVLQSLNSAIL
jgi:hypothetical protein